MSVNDFKQFDYIMQQFPFSVHWFLLAMLTWFASILISCTAVVTSSCATLISNSVRLWLPPLFCSSTVTLKSRDIVVAWRAENAILIKSRKLQPHCNYHCKEPGNSVWDVNTCPWQCMVTKTGCLKKKRFFVKIQAWYEIFADFSCPARRLLFEQNSPKRYKIYCQTIFKFQNLADPKVETMNSNLWHHLKARLSPLLEPGSAGPAVAVQPRAAPHPAPCWICLPECPQPERINKF